MGGTDLEFGKLCNAMSHANTISARQLIYTNVEADQSPSKRAGFQILLASKGISEADKAEVSQRLVYSSPSKENAPTKNVFYPTQSGDLLLAQIVLLPEPDGANRFGRYLAHALMFSPAEFEELNNDPFPIFENFSFLVTVEAALERGDRVTGEIVPEGRSVTSWNGEGLDSTVSRTRILDEVDSQNRRQLLLLATQLASNENERNSLGLFGDPTTAYRYLSALIAITPKSLRPRCSFDTFAGGGNLNSAHYWAVGLPAEAQRTSRLFAFNLAQEEFDQEIFRSPETTYQKWLDEQSHRKASEIAEESGVVAQFMEWLENPETRLVPPQNRAESLVLTTLTNLNMNAIEKRLQDRLTQQTGEFLAPVLAPQIISPLLLQHSIGSAITICQRGFTLDQLEDSVRTLCVNSKIGLTPDVLSDIERFANANNLNRLRLAVLHLARQWEQLTNALHQASESDYQFFANRALESLPIRLQWNVEHKGSSLSFGPQLKIVGAQKSDLEADFCPLLYALLGKNWPEQTSWFNPTRKHREDVAAPPNIRRWFWLMDELEKRHDQRTQQNRSSAPISTRKMNPNPFKR